ncbi:MAG: hypothetical protein ACYS5V_17675, partial [Planctomycetota bacterium]|jgi:hypothetical protein
MLTDSIPFGTWRIPIGFQETKNGGTCATGCHRKLGYDRENPLRQAAPPTPPAKPPGPEAAGEKVAAGRPGLVKQLREPAASPPAASPEEATQATTAPAGPAGKAQPGLPTTQLQGHSQIGAHLRAAMPCPLWPAAAREDGSVVLLPDAPMASGQTSTGRLE